MTDAGKNLVFSYSLKDDVQFAELGFTYLGSSLDRNGVEVNVFQKWALPSNDLTSAERSTINYLADCTIKGRFRS